MIKIGKKKIKGMGFFIVGSIFILLATLWIVESWPERWERDEMIDTYCRENGWARHAWELDESVNLFKCARNIIDDSGLGNDVEYSGDISYSVLK